MDVNTWLQTKVSLIDNHF